MSKQANLRNGWYLYRDIQWLWFQAGYNYMHITKHKNRAVVSWRCDSFTSLFLDKRPPNPTDFEMRSILQIVVDAATIYGITFENLEPILNLAEMLPSRYLPKG